MDKARRENFLSEPRGSEKKRDGTSCICVYSEGKKNYYYRAVLVCTAKEKKPIPTERYLCVRQRLKKTNRVPRRLGQPARHPVALRCDGPCRRDQHIYTALPRQGVWAPTTTIAMVRR